MRHEGECSVFAVAFSPDGKTVLTGSADHTARRWDVPSPAKDDPVRLGLSVEVRSGYTTDGQGRMQRLSQAEWRAKLKELPRLGGPCDIRAWPDAAEKE